MVVPEAIIAGPSWPPVQWWTTPAMITMPAAARPAAVPVTWAGLLAWGMKDRRVPGCGAGFESRVESLIGLASDVSQ